MKINYYYVKMELELWEYEVEEFLEILDQYEAPQTTATNSFSAVPGFDTSLILEHEIQLGRTSKVKVKRDSPRHLNSSLVEIENLKNRIIVLEERLEQEKYESSCRYHFLLKRLESLEKKNGN